jgi:hypothetical protein
LLLRFHTTRPKFYCSYIFFSLENSRSHSFSWNLVQLKCYEREPFSFAENYRRWSGTCTVIPPSYHATWIVGIVHWRYAACTVIPLATMQCNAIDACRERSNVKPETYIAPCLSARLRLCLRLCSVQKKSTMRKKKIPCHIKLAIHAWSTKCRWNQKLIVQLGCTLRDERFESN